MTIDTEQLARMERRQEVLIKAIDGLADVVSINNAMSREMLDWLKQPPKSDLPDVLKALLAAVEEMRAEIHGLPARIAKAIHAENPMHR